MLKNQWLIVLFVVLAIPIKAFALGATSVSIEANQYVKVGEPIQVSVLVTHDRSSKVDENSFTQGRKPLNVLFSKNVSMGKGTNLVISFYSYTIPPKEKGSYTIPPVSVKVDGKEYTSYEGSYNVQ